MTRVRAVFLDRDGVLNEMPLNEETKEYDSPYSIEELKICDGAFSALTQLKDSFQLFIVSNQPGYAKGKATMTEILDVARAFENQMKKNSIPFRQIYYCFHHPEAVVPELRKKCECRKPGNLFLKEAAAQFNIDLKNSWMVGDRDIDVECGQSVGCKTILVKYPHSKHLQGQSKPTFIAQNMVEAARCILGSLKEEIRNE